MMLSSPSRSHSHTQQNGSRRSECVLCHVTSCDESCDCPCSVKFSQRSSKQELFFPKTLEVCHVISCSSHMTSLSLSLSLSDPLALHHQLSSPCLSTLGLCHPHFGESLSLSLSLSLSHDSLSLSLSLSLSHWLSLSLPQLHNVMSLCLSTLWALCLSLSLSL